MQGESRLQFEGALSVSAVGNQADESLGGRGAAAPADGEDEDGAGGDCGAVMMLIFGVTADGVPFREDLRNNRKIRFKSYDDCQSSPKATSLLKLNLISVLKLCRNFQHLGGSASF